MPAPTLTSVNAADSTSDATDTDPASIKADIYNGYSGVEFQPQATYVAGTDPDSVTTADLGVDGPRDLVVANSGGVDVLLGNGSGGFVEEAAMRLV